MRKKSGFAHEARAEIKKARINFERKLANSIRSDTNFFSHSLREKGEAKIKVGPILDSKGVSVSASEDMCNEFNDFLEHPVETGLKILGFMTSFTTYCSIPLLHTDISDSVCVRALPVGHL